MEEMPTSAVPSSAYRRHDLEVDTLRDPHSCRRAGLMSFTEVSWAHHDLQPLSFSAQWRRETLWRIWDESRMMAGCPCSKDHADV